MIMETIGSTISGTLSASIIMVLLLVSSGLSPSKTALPSSTPMVYLHPPSLLIPENESVVFTCEVVYNRGYSFSWYIDDKPLVSEAPDLNIQELNDANNIYKIKFNATQSLNNTSFSCYVVDHHNLSLYNRSDSARLLVLELAPLPKNPFLRKSSTSFRLLWSAPYLWRGYYIDYFNISVTNLSDGSVMYDKVNALHNHSIESYDLAINWICSELFIEIRAFSCYDGWLNGTYNVSGKFSSENDESIALSELITKVLFDANAIPLLRIQLELPPLCSYEEVTIENTVFAAVDDNGMPTNTYTEILNHTGSGIVHHEIDSANLTLNENYTLKVVVILSDVKNMTFEYPERDFNTGLRCGAYRNLSRKSIVAIMLLVFCTFVYVPQYVSIQQAT